MNDTLKAKKNHFKFPIEIVWENAVFCFCCTVPMKLLKEFSVLSFL